MGLLYRLGLQKLTGGWSGIFQPSDHPDSAPHMGPSAEAESTMMAAKAADAIEKIQTTAGAALADAKELVRATTDPAVYSMPTSPQHATAELASPPPTSTPCSGDGVCDWDRYRLLLRDTDDIMAHRHATLEAEIVPLWEDPGDVQWLFGLSLLALFGFAAVWAARHPLFRRSEIDEEPISPRKRGQASPRKELRSRYRARDTPGEISATRCMDAT